MTYDAIVDYLYNIPRFTKGGHMSNVRRLLAALGDPQDSFKYIHVAGTNGKGSVCAYMERCLRLGGYKTGLFTSPHLVRVNERMRICGQEISDEDFVRIFHEIQALAKQMEKDGCQEPTFFEYIYLMAMVYFKEQQIDFGIVEAGMGGRLDFSNSAAHPVLTLLTPISLDHETILGPTVEAIAREKAGIIKAGSPLVYYGQDPRAAAVIQETVKVLEIKAEVLMDDQLQILRDDGKTIDFSLDCGYHGKYQFTLNTAAAYQTVNAGLAVLGMLMLQKYFVTMDSEAVLLMISKGLSQARWPGRMEALSANLYVDGAHNEAGIDAFVDTIGRGFAKKPLYLVFAVAADKDYKTMIQKLCNLDNLAGVVVTELENGRRCDLEEALSVFKKNWNGILDSTYNIREALTKAMDMSGSDGMVCCVGSLYLVGSIKELTGGNLDDKL